MNVEIGSYAAKTKLPELLRQVKAGNSFTITNRGEAIADLTPISRRRGKTKAEAVDSLKAFMAAAPDAHIDLKALIEEGRAWVSYWMSVSMRWLFGDGKPHELEYATDILECLSKAKALVPVTWALEVANVVARAEAKDLLTEARSETFLELLADLEIRDDNATSGHALTKTLGLARRYNLSSYDAS